MIHNLDRISLEFKNSIKNQFDLIDDADELRYAIMKVDQKLMLSKHFRVNSDDDIENYLTRGLLKIGRQLVRHKNRDEMYKIKQVFRAILLDTYDDLINKKNRVDLNYRLNKIDKKTDDELNRYHKIVYC